MTHLFPANQTHVVSSQSSSSTGAFVPMPTLYLASSLEQQSHTHSSTAASSFTVSSDNNASANT